jgi:cytochrome c
MRNALMSLVALIGFGVVAQAAERYDIGRSATQEEIRAWDIDVRADGSGLPPGRGSVAQGARLYAEKCASCHGDHGQGGPMDRLAGGSSSSLVTAKAVKTVGSYWPYASTLFDYVRRAMPFNAPQSLTDDEVYAVTAYVLHLNGILPDGAALDASTLPQIRMPNARGFVADPRPDVASPPCRSDCR